MPRTRRVIVAILACLLFAVPVPATASTGLQVSADGDTWRDQLTDPLFSPDRRWIPGEMAISPVSVRQGGAPAAAVALRAHLTGAPELVGPTGLRVSARTPGRPWQVLPNCVTVTVLDALPRDEAAMIEIRVELPWSAPNSTRNRTAALDLTVVADDGAAAPVDPSAGCGTGGDPIIDPAPGADPSPVTPAEPGTAPRGGDAPHGALPNTGSEVGAGLLVLGLLALLGGVLVLQERRRA